MNFVLVLYYQYYKKKFHVSRSTSQQVHGSRFKHQASAHLRLVVHDFPYLAGSETRKNRRAHPRHKEKPRAKGKLQSGSRIHSRQTEPWNTARMKDCFWYQGEPGLRTMVHDDVRSCLLIATMSCLLLTIVSAIGSRSFAFDDAASSDASIILLFFFMVQWRCQCKSSCNNNTLNKASNLTSAFGSLLKQCVQWLSSTSDQLWIHIISNVRLYQGRGMLASSWQWAVSSQQYCLTCFFSYWCRQDNAYDDWLICLSLHCGTLELLMLINSLLVKQHCTSKHLKTVDSSESSHFLLTSQSLLNGFNHPTNIETKSTTGRLCQKPEWSRRRY